ncbi:MAG: hypothetical protein KC766_13635 [Myxococcales bacterium]|nr:hypothetical protein [Myxococcales bacterium]
MPRVALLVLLGALSGACSLVAGDLPDAVDQQHAGSGGVAGTDSSGGIGGSSGSAGAAASGGEAGAATGGSGNASGVGGSAGTIGGSGGSGACIKPCDCDDDGGQATSCGGTDCDDHDARVFEGQTEYFIEASTNPKVLFDFDCSGKIERDPPLDREVSCGLLSLTGCKGQGFSGTAPTCGVQADWGECRADGLTCKHVKLSTRVMACH